MTKLVKAVFLAMLVQSLAPSLYGASGEGDNLIGNEKVSSYTVYVPSDASDQEAPKSSIGCSCLKKAVTKAAIYGCAIFSMAFSGFILYETFSHLNQCPSFSTSTYNQVPPGTTGWCCGSFSNNASNTSAATRWCPQPVNYPY